ncbi:putative hybrid NRPS/PKS enzyme [Tothia fuscella]|uniref:Hybrid NRPS/PKS enzyme n=1 Tax=Tothia fuscella TaxID=1048955 RepID=A0A9P4NUE2_9PEZI|nr:putative hybrid NRPS/PKS enzyme [Tothia fuscella]
MSTPEPIAIVGSGCRFPGAASNPSKLWELLSQPRDLTKKIPKERFNADAFYHPDGGHHGATNVRYAYTLEEDFRHFDAQFFQTKPVEANSIDPQQRILLETVYEAIEAAGIGIERLQGTETAVYVGVMSGDYNDLVLKDIDSIPTYLSTGTARSILSNRISYFFDWHGPSMTIDTACSSSLVAVHQAVQTLQSGSSNVAVAAGSNLILMPENFIAESKLNMLSPNGRSRMWDQGADGYARGDGFAAIIMKRLSDALKDGDEIECIIRGSGVNQDGRTKGITMPSSDSQAALIQSTYARSGLDLTKDSDRPQYFEAHGTGTPAGDPTEARAIHTAFFTDMKPHEGVDAPKLWVGSVKTIIGHTEGTAGLAGLLKASLALKHASIPPNLHLNTLNPSVKPYYKYLEIPTSLQRWPVVAAGAPRRASVNSFGFGGTNAHVILESYDPSTAPATTTEDKDPALSPFVFSASSQGSLRRALSAYSAYVKDHKSIRARDLAHTLTSRRSNLPIKVSFYAENLDTVIEKLDGLGERTENPGTDSSSGSPRILGIFTGQGAQYAQMGRELVLSSRAVKETIQRLEDYLSELPIADRPSWSLTSELLADSEHSRVGEATIAQPLCTAVQIVLVDLLRSANIKLTAVVGHSSGEIGAAYAAGYLNNREAIYVAYYRGLHSRLAGIGSKQGAMMAVGTSPEDAKELCEFEEFHGRIVVAAVNSGASITLSGDADAIEEAEAVLKDEKKFARLLKVDKAYHSHHMLPCSDPYLASLKASGIKSTQHPIGGVTWYSSVYGAEVRSEYELSGEYWNKNLVNPVLFKQAIEVAVANKDTFDLALEIGPHSALQGPALQVLSDALGKSIPYIGLLGRGKNAVEVFSAGLGSIWNQFTNTPIDFASLERFAHPRVAQPKLLKDLPSYPWDHDRVFWHESSLSKAFRTRTTMIHELLGTRLADGSEHEQRWRNLLSLKEVPWLQGHQLQGAAVFPAAGYVAMAIESSLYLEATKGIKTIEVSDLTIQRPITFDDESTGVETLFTLTSIEKDLVGNTLSAEFKVFSVHSKDSGMALMAHGKVHLDYGSRTESYPPIRTTSTPDLVSLDTDRFYRALKDLGYGYSGDFKGLHSLQRKLGFGTGSVRNPDSSNGSRPLLVHPGMLDSAFQTVFLAYSWPGDGRLWSLHVPTYISKIRVNVGLAQDTLSVGGDLSFDCVLRHSSTSAIYGDVDIYSAAEGGHALIQIEGMNAVPFSPATVDDDRIVFAEIGWSVASPNGPIVADNYPVGAATDLSEVSIDRLGSIVTQITNRYPRLRILEVGATHAARSGSILKQVGQAFGNYVFSASSEAYLEALRKEFTDHSHLERMRFQVLDVESDPVEQGFKENSFDLTIVPLVLHSVRELDKVLKNLHLLLRPGGFIVALEPVRQKSGNLNIVLSAAQWSLALRKAGFSGIDTITPGIGDSDGAISVFASQAIDDRVLSLRRPLQSTFTSSRPLTIVGGTVLETSDLVHDLAFLLGQHFSGVQIVESLDTLDSNQIQSASTVLSLVDLDEPTFQNMTAIKLEALKQLFDKAKTVLWLTRGCLSDDPYANMIVGFGRTLLLEMSHLRLQFFDIASEVVVRASTIAEALLGLQIVDEVPMADVLWSIEPELALDHHHGVLIPRVRPSQVRNDRYNSSRRSIRKLVSSGDSTIAVEHDTSSLHPNGSYVLRETVSLKYAQSSYLETNTPIEVHYSFPAAIKVNPVGYLFPVMGCVVGTGRKVIALSEIHASTINVPPAWVHDYNTLEDEVPESLWQASLYLVAVAILSSIPHHETIVVHDAEPAFATIFFHASKTKSITTIFTTTKEHSATEGITWLSIHPNTPQRTIEASLPKAIGTFVQLSLSTDTAVETLIRAALARHHRILNAASFLSPKAIINAFSTDSPTVSELSSTIAEACSLQRLVNGTVHIPSLDEISSKPYGSFSTILDWTTSGSTLVTVEPVDSKPLFAKDRTYFLAGLAGDLGRSLTKWMVDHGARYIVLTSRNPKVDERWLKSFAETGVTVQVLANDITDREALGKLVTDLSLTLPPIAGVANGAMVLEDCPVADMTIEKMQKVLKPKVQGSLYLDELFPTDNLDFFIFFSSVASVVGNRGQSSYSAANAFMVSLAAQRRKRGLAGSVIDIGAIVGTGYLTREVSQSVQDYLHKAGYMWMSEVEFLHVFAEGVVAGKSNNPHGHEVASGLRMVKGAEKDIVWYNNPRFQHCVLNKDSAVVVDDGSNSTLPIKAQLSEAKDAEAIFDILIVAFSSKLQNALLLEHDLSLLERTADDLGIDSLVAVAIRSWFLKELDVDMPVMKILGGSTVEDLLNYALRRLPFNTTSKDETINAEETKSHEPSQLPKPSSTPESLSESPAAEPAEKHDERSWTRIPEDLSTSSSEDETVQTLATSRSSSISRAGTDSNSSSKSVQPMSFGQSRFWFMHLLLEDKTTFNVTCLLRLKGPLRIPDLANAVKILGLRHEGLRTSFSNKDGQGIQEIMDEPSLYLEQATITENRDAVLEYKRMEQHTFELQQGKTMRIKHLTLDKDEHYLIVSYHHINMDGISFMVLVQDLAKLYSGKVLAAPALQYSTFSAVQLERWNSGKFKDDILYWKKEYPDLPPVLPILPLSTVMTRKPMTRFDSHKAELRIPAPLRRKVQEVSRKLKVTPFHFFLAVFQTLLARFSDVEDLSIGIADSGRSDDGAFESIGNYLNLLPLRFHPRLSREFEDVLKESKLKTYSAMGASGIPVDVLFNELGVGRSATYSPLFQAFMDYRNVRETQDFGDCVIEGQEYSIGRTGYDITLDIIDNQAGESLVSFLVQKDLYRESDACILLHSFLHLADAFATNSKMKLGFPSLYAKAGIESSMKVGQGPVFEHKWATLPHALDEITRDNPSKVALTDGNGQKLTYAEMASRVNEIANTLIATAGGARQHNPRIGVLQTPGTDWICSILAIQRIGGTYIPLDLKSGLPRLAAIAEESKLSFILTQEDTVHHAHSLKPEGSQIVNISQMSTDSSTTSPNLAQSESTAIILFTSGSTGTPKGIALSHRALQNQMEGAIEMWQFKSQIVLQQSAYSFDLSVWQIYLALLSAGTLVIAPVASRNDPIALTNLIKREGVTITCGVPSEYMTWLRFGDVQELRDSNWKMIVSGGEQFSEVLVRQLRDLGKLDLRAMNLYGPAEATVSATQIEVLFRDEESLKERIPAGNPMPNYAIYILDGDDPVPVGVPGEIVIAGSISSGYTNSEQLNKERFVKNPFASSVWLMKGWDVMHRSGDRGRIRASDGALVFEGRIAGDTQIKLRGVRIELRDIESSMLAAARGHLSNAIVSVRGEDEYLVAHAVFSQSSSIDKDSKEQFLLDLAKNLHVPSYMKPSLVLSLDQIPLNASGKVDRIAIRQLPLPHATPQDENTTFTGDLSTTEAHLKSIWLSIVPQDVSTRHKVGPQSDFFQIGGSSILLIKLQAAIKKFFSISVPLLHLFEFSTLQQMAAAIEQHDELEISPVIDFDIETELELELRQIRTNPRKQVIDAPKDNAVVITGSTGFLGRELLRQLVISDSVTKIYCIALRNPIDQKSSKIEKFRGDLTLPLLGLSEDDARAIFTKANIIIHNGADVSFLKTYQSLKAANLTSTKELVRLASVFGTNTRFHYVSTAGVSQLIDGDVLHQASVAASKPPTNGSNGYIATKWASERFLEKANKDINLSVAIHRPSSVFGEGAPSSDIMQNLLRLSRELKAVPELDFWHGYIDLVSVQNVASGILSQAEDGGVSDVVRYIHHSGEVEIPVRELKAYLEKESEAEFEVLVPEEWARRSRGLGLHELVASYMLSRNGGVNLNTPRIGKL